MSIDTGVYEQLKLKYDAMSDELAKANRRADDYAGLAASRARLIDGVHDAMHEIIAEIAVGGSGRFSNSTEAGAIKTYVEMRLRVALGEFDA